MSERLKEFLSLVESESKRLDEAARNFEQLAAKLKEEEKAEWDLLAAIYRERAQAIQSFAERMRQSLVADGSAELRTEDA
ncbi:MAG TPA: hypothetical protein VN902_02875 [Candidatus Acidoferrales bacterium]|jgi:hypothetical protein|nr:hypothetical protein [Candidatus Acidoferrales bacterium]